jgi:uncharacterized protein YgiM (DUF1202 family)
MQLVFKRLVIILLVLVVFAFVAYAGEFNEFRGQINISDVNVRLDATTGSAVVCLLSQADQVEVISQAYDWYKIRLPKTAPAYIKKELVECISLDSSHQLAKLQNQCKSGKVIKDRVNIRFAASESSWILGKVDKFTVVNILAQEGAWLKIEPVHASFGWVNKKFVNKVDQESSLPKKEVKPEIASTNNVLSDALTLEGIVSPYGVVLWRKATHKLTTADNKIYFLKGNRKGLDSLNYHQVKVKGKFITPADSKYPIVDVAIIEALN